MRLSHVNRETEAEETASKAQIKGLWEENNNKGSYMQLITTLFISLSEFKYQNTNKNIICRSSGKTDR